MKLTPGNTKIGFIGIGVMGKSVAGRLLDAGYAMCVHNRTRHKAQGLIERGAVWKDSPGAVAGECNVIFTMVGFPSDVEKVYFGGQGIIGCLRRGSYVIDLTTSSPDIAVRIHEAAGAKGALALDAPVSGGDVGAREGRLSIMVGGDREAFEAVLPLFQLMGTNIVFQGGPGSGQHTKMCNQIAIAANMLGVCEAIAYAEKAGLDIQSVLKSIGGGAAASWSLSNLAPRIIRRDFAPGFFVKHFIKDMTIAAQAARAMGLATPGLDLAKSRYEQLARQGGADDGTQALYKLYLQARP